MIEITRGVKRMQQSNMEVAYLAHMGSDLNVVNAARVSFAKLENDFDLERDTKLINYLAKHNHWSPLAHTSISIRVKAPIFMARQFVKHQVGGVWNEVSRRYVDDTPEFWFPREWRGRPVNAKQGSSNDIITKLPITDIATGQIELRDIENIVYLHAAACERIYNSLLDAGVAPEQARVVLPQNVMTEWVWTGSLVFFARVCKLRLDHHAQKEAQELALKIHEVVAPLYPVSWAALMEHMKV